MCQAFPGQFDRHTFALEPVNLVLSAWTALQEEKRKHYHLAGLQVAELTSLLFNINRDPKRGKATSRDDWALFAKEEIDEADELPSVVAHVCLALRHEQRLPALLLGIWPDVVKRSDTPGEIPEIRALVNADSSVVLVAPEWEGRSIRAFLALKGRKRGEVVELVDIDRPMMSYSVQLPTHIQPVHYEAAVLMVERNVSSRAHLEAISS